MSINDLQAECNKAMELVFNHFHRSEPITFYKDAQETVVAHNPNWNSDFLDYTASNIEYSVEKREILCRIWFYDNNELLKSIEGDDNLSLKLSYPLAKIKLAIKAEDFDWLKNTKSFIFLNNKFIKDSDWRGVGMLQEINYYEITLKKNQ